MTEDVAPQAAEAENNLSRTPPCSGIVTRKLYADAKTGRIFYLQE
jgi:hypothetical protein